MPKNSWLKSIKNQEAREEYKWKWMISYLWKSFGTLQPKLDKEEGTIENMESDLCKENERIRMNHYR